MSRLRLLLIGAAVLTGCGKLPYENTVCTLIGCSNGLQVTIETQPSGPWRIEAATSGETRVFDCPTGSACPGAFFEGFLPSQVSITVTIGGRTRTQLLTPTQRTVRPNGPQCGPECQQPFVNVAPPPP
jgi:hypothetical protein